MPPETHRAATTTAPAIPPIDKLVVLGTGLIGGSFAIALRAAGEARTIVGVGRGRANLETALAAGIIDRGVTLDSDWQTELADADVVLLATPVAQFRALLSAIAPHTGARTIITDAGSTKQNVIDAARATLRSQLPRFVPAHPIAGTEHSGAAAAFGTLFRDRNVVLTPLPETDHTAVATIAALWTACGARVCTMDAIAHDRVFAAVSHLPHVLAFALVDAFAARDNAQELFRFAASGFRDFTRIAGSSPEMWRDISLANRDALLSEIAAFRTQLDRIARIIEQNDDGALEALFARARAARRDWEGRQNASAMANQDQGRDGA